MARATKVTLKTTPQGDINTTAGFLATYDLLARELNTFHHWCDDGTRYPYQYTDGKIETPARRTNVNHIAFVDDDDLSDAGRAKKAAGATEGLETAREGAVAVAIYGLSNGYLESGEMEAAFAILGIPPLVRAEPYAASVSAWARFSVGSRDFRTEHPELSDKIKDAVTAILSDAGVTPRESGVDLSVDRFPTTTWSAAPAAPADAVPAS